MSTQLKFASLFENDTKFVYVGPEWVAYEDSEEPNSSLANRKNTVVCLPGLGDCRQQYRFLVHKFVDAGYRVLALDLRGLGESSTGFKSFQVEDIVSDVIAILEKEEISYPVTILGHSISAAVAVHLASKYPERIKNIVAIGGLFRPMMLGMNAVIFKDLHIRSSILINCTKDSAFIHLRFLFFTNLWGASAWLGYFKSMFKKPPSDLPEYCEIDEYHLNEDKKRIKAISALLVLGSAKKDVSLEKIRNIKCSVLLLIGSDDPNFKNPQNEINTIVDAFNERKLENQIHKFLVSGAGHYPHVEFPEEVFTNIQAFISYNNNIIQIDTQI
ncbi:hypothetical protein HK096_004413 [Nowakowskiella sp. JEL0078]|nr:hypothetical protein HK096_004413 [Nowakowskiella sp. JEL0078]